MPDRNYLKEVEDAFRAKRETAEAEAERRRFEVHELIPEVIGIDRELSKTGGDILSAIIGGGDVQGKVGEIRKRNEELRRMRGELLLSKGLPADYTAVVRECDSCGDSGYVGINMCGCMRKAIADLKLSDSELGRLAFRQSFDNFDVSFFAEGEERDRMIHIKNKLKRFAEGFSRDSSESWLLLGDTGLGKTHLSTSVGVTVIKRGYDVMYKTVQAMIDDFEEVQFKGGRGDMTRGYYDCDLLIVDDMGAEMTNQFTLSCIYNVINARMNKSKSTIISTNLSQRELRERYADRITSRLFGEYIPLVFKGKDIRQQKLMRGYK